MASVPGDGHNTPREGVLVFQPLHLRDGHGGHGGRSGRGRAAHGAETRVGHDRGDGHTSGQVTQPLVARLEDIVDDLGFDDELGHEDEQGNRRERVGGRRPVGGGAQDAHEAVEAAHEKDADGAAYTHGKSDGHPDCDQDDHPDKRQGHDQLFRHVQSSLPRCRSPFMKGGWICFHATRSTIRCLLVLFFRTARRTPAGSAGTKGRSRWEPWRSMATWDSRRSLWRSR